MIIVVLKCSSLVTEDVPPLYFLIALFCEAFTKSCIVLIGFVLWEFLLRVLNVSSFAECMHYRSESMPFSMFS
jgi:urea transporter